MDEPLLMLMRHAEKPDASAGIGGVRVDGTPDERSLSVRGWQRAGALVRWFEPAHGVGPQGTRPACPRIIFAASATAAHPSRRPVETVEPLAGALGVRVLLRDSGDEPLHFAAELLVQPSPVLVCWRHDGLAPLARALLPGVTMPERWAAGRYDMMWLIEPASGRFRQIAQQLLPGDSAGPII